MCLANIDKRMKISIHALREEGDRGVQRGQQQQGDFYPRPPRGGRPCENGCGAYWEDISIHALREEGDAGGGFPSHNP